MAMTITEKILAAHAGCDEVQPGQLIEARVDVALANDVTAPIAIAEFEQLGIEKVFDPDRVILVPDHFTPNKDINSAEQAKIVRDFSRRQQLTNYFEQGRVGIEHVLLPEQGLVLPGDLIIGADSHTCTYGALGAFATGVGSTDLAAAMATGKVWFKVPESIKLVYHGTPGPWVEGKDLILYTIGRLGVDGALYQSMEMQGEAIEKLPMYGRFTMANMAIEAGAKNGIITPDQAQNHPRSHIIRRYLGSKNAVVPDLRLKLAPDESDAEAVANQGMRLFPGDKLVLCSDGLSDLVSDAEIFAAFQENSLPDALASLVELANKNGGHDNITILALKVPDSGETPRGVVMEQKMQNPAIPPSLLPWVIGGAALLGVLLLLVLVVLFLR
jgi:homoaconitase/3-isopropylmalate dehydratase large subunit